MVTRRFRSFHCAAVIFAFSLLVVAGCARKAEEPMPPPGPPEITGSAGPIYVDDGGTGGIPVVFVHSYAGSAAHWQTQLDHLRPTRRALAIDLRGHGRSQAPADGDYRVESLAGDIAAVADGLKLSRFVLVGHSMGGAASIAYAGGHSDRVAGLVMVGTPGKSPAEMATQVISSLETDYDNTMGQYLQRLLEGAQPAVATQLGNEMKSISREASLVIIRAVFDYDPTAALNAYTGPKLIVDTEHRDSPGALHNLAPQVSRTVIAGTSHWPHMDKPDEFNRILDEFLKTLH
jgi:pimeloyl-ACP methyl ester carboxylesterase